MRRAIWTVASLGLLTLLVTMAPDIRRYLRMRTM
jgi:hypothetical protein